MEAKKRKVEEGNVKNVCLIVIDGWGISKKVEGNAILNAKTPYMESFKTKYPYCELSAHGLAVGLPDGLMGNSEVGHLNIGAGRIVYQDIVRIDLAIKTQTIRKNHALISAFDRAKSGNGRLHLLGLVSDGGVHSHIDHIYGLVEAAKEAGVPSVFIHFFADGRDTKPTSAIDYAHQLDNFLKKLGYGSIATVTGRYYAMDRDKRWERIKIAYDSLVSGEGEETQDLFKTINDRYAKNETDEFLKPIIVNKDGIIQDNDTLLFFNFRSDRMREIVEAIGFEEKKFEPKAVRKNLEIYNLTRYKSEFPFQILFPPQSMDNVLSEWLSKQNIQQYHAAETEKYAHVTFFFNGGTEKEFPLEDRKMIPSPKVATYDLQPEMAALQVAEDVAKTIESKKYPFVMCNFAPPDMVGHTGKYQEAIKGVEATDHAIGIIYESCKANGYILFVTADHGNAEQMTAESTNEEGKVVISPHTAHTCNKVPFVMASETQKFVSEGDFSLCDVAPTVLDVMGISIPSDMTGKSLINHE